jgi:hypothetical protein
MRTPTTDRITHPLNVSYLVVGLVCLGLAGIWALRSAGLVDTRQIGWLLPLTLVGAGVAGLVGFAAKGISRSRTRRDEPADDRADIPADDNALGDIIDNEGDLR